MEHFFWKFFVNALTTAEFCWHGVYTFRANTCVETFLYMCLFLLEGKEAFYSVLNKM